MSSNAQPSTWFGAVPVISHVPGPAYEGSIDQLIPAPPGSGSVSVTDRAMPTLSPSRLVTVTVNPMLSPVLTDVSSAVFVIDRSGASTSIVAESLTVGAFD